jgi:predicted dehydrogenase
MTKQWGVGILGLGHWYSANGLARAFPEYEKARLVAVADPIAAKRDAFATTFGISAHASYEELLARPDVDIVHISAPVAEIPACTIKAARAGKHLILGKPMAMTLEQADEMVAAVRSAGVTCVPFQGMFRVTQAGLKQRIADGLIGDVVVIHATGRWAIAEDWFRSGNAGWFVDPKQVPGGALIDEGIYSIDQLRWLAGSEVVEVQARVANLVHTDLPVEDWGFSTFTYANGVVATLEASWTINSPRKTAPAPKHNAVIRLEIVGTRGEIIQDSLHAPQLAVLSAGASEWVFERPTTEFSVPSTPGPLDYLIHCLETGEQPASTIEDTRVSLRTALAAYESARLGRAIRLD